jgi:hypothetical protein
MHAKVMRRLFWDKDARQAGRRARSAAAWQVVNDTVAAANADTEAVCEMFSEVNS